MFVSLPLIVPRDAYTLWSPVSDHHTTPPSLPTQDAHNQQPHQPHQHRRSPSSTARPTHLSLLKAEEDALASRKANVRRFGSTWIRPPGITKTYQAMVDEAAEKAEAEAAAEREANAQEAAAVEEARVREAVARGELGSDALPGTGEGGSMVEGIGIGMERDLDDEVPEADGEGAGENEEDESMDEEDGEHDGVDGEHDEVAESERDLDEDVPEAGGYEHTDTEVEDTSSDEDDFGVSRHPEQEAVEHITPVSRGSGGSVFGRGPQVVQNFRMPLPMPVLQPTGSARSTAHTEPDSSMVVSSPIAARPARRGLQGTPQGRARRGSYRVGSGRHGEN